MEAQQEHTRWRLVGDAVRARRLELGYTQDEAVQAAGQGLSVVVWSILENARQDRYKPRTLAAICRALGWTPDSIERILAGGRPQLVDDAAADDRLDQVLEELAEIRRRLDVLENPGRPGKPSLTPIPTGRRAAQERRYRKGDDGPPAGQEDV